MGLSTFLGHLYYDYEFDIEVLDKKSGHTLLLRQTVGEGPKGTGW